MPDKQERNCCDSKVLLQWISPFLLHLGIPWWLSGKESAAMQEMQVQPLGQEDPLEELMAAHSSILAWRILWIEEPGGL